MSSNVVRRPDAHLSLVQHALDHGASPVRCQARGGIQDEPVPLAVSHGRRDMLQLFLSEGPSIHGRRFGRGRDRVLQVPIFAAAAQMGSRGPQLVHDCLKEGAMVNHTARIIDMGRPLLRARVRRDALVPLLIYVYLAAITD